ncbi:MAG: ATP:cob(I)alamin adenosyltransferase [Elusimicrobiota bacterium]|jgi:cob(I)alamin adenosyltransferase|nr:ATP:cob(I)alamin adenosyltransferase [Elusimicrobiota bacterium]
MTVRKGDAGFTDSLARQNISKADPRIIALAHLDCLNAELGAAKLACPALAARLEGLQNILIEVMGIISGTGKTLAAAHTAALEERIAALKAATPPLTKFILPGMSPADAALHRARASARLAETACVAAAAPQETLAFINRLSLYLFMEAYSLSARPAKPV